MNIDLEKIKKSLQEFFDLAEIKGSLTVNFQEPATIKISLQTEEAPILIGEKGETLLGLQALLKKILTKRWNQKFFIELDINDYREKKRKYLQELAEMAADEAILNQSLKSLPPMSAWERRIIHLALAERSDVKTESQGAGEQRHVIIVPL